MNRLILIRHGQSEHHIRGLTGGWTDTPLTALGQAQAIAAGQRCRQLLNEECAFCLYSSDLMRASQTARFIADALRVDSLFEPGLREINNGVAANKTLEEATKIELRETEPRHDWIPYPDAESWTMMSDRVSGALARIADSCPSTAIIVTHGLAGIAVIHWWLELDGPSRGRISFELDPASITELRINSYNERTIVRLNDTAHLDSFPQ
jgi:probable phosphoglycerate mutase